MASMPVSEVIREGYLNSVKRRNFSLTMAAVTGQFDDRNV